MTFIFILIATLFLGAFLVFVLWPWLSLKKTKSPFAGELLKIQACLHEKEIVFENFKELELDHQMGKLDDQDFAQLKAALQAEAASKIDDYDRMISESRLVGLVEQDVRNRQGASS